MSPIKRLIQQKGILGVLLHAPNKGIESFHVWEFYMEELQWYDHRKCTFINYHNHGAHLGRVCATYSSVETTRDMLSDLFVYGPTKI